MKLFIPVALVTLLTATLFSFPIAAVGQSKPKLSKKEAVDAKAIKKEQVDGFRSFKWGTNREEIIAAQGVPDLVLPADTTGWGVYTGGAITYYDVMVANRAAEVNYGFAPGCTDKSDSPCPLTRGGYTFSSKNRSELEVAYDAVELELTAKYGPPTNIDYSAEDSLRVNKRTTQAGTVFHMLRTSHPVVPLTYYEVVNYERSATKRSDF